MTLLRRRWTAVLIGLLVASVCVVSVSTGIALAAPRPSGSAAPAPGPTMGLGPVGTSLMHGDLWSSDSTPFAGPGVSAHVAASSVPGGACAATFIGGDGFPVSLCTQYVGTAPLSVAVATVTLFDPKTAAPIARRQLTKGGLLGGVYGYLDDRDRVVVADGSGAILRVAHRHSSQGQLYVDDRIDLAAHVPAGDSVTALAPDFAGRTWFVTTHGVVGTVDDARRVRSMHLPAGEDLGNGLSVRATGVSVISTHALYEMRAAADGTPEVLWRREYDRGPARRPGQLTWGSGTTPTYFGPGGDGWVAIVDNASRPQLIVYDSNNGETVCRIPAFGSSGQGTENSPMAWGNSLIIPSTYGYQYPPMAVTGASIPGDAPFVGGSTRIDVTAAGCRRVWENGDRLASLPRLSRADGLIHGLGYGPYRPGAIQQVGPIDYIATDFATGARVRTLHVGEGPVDEPLELTGTIGPDGALWQATATRMIKVAPR